MQWNGEERELLWACIHARLCSEEIESNRQGGRKRGGSEEHERKEVRGHDLVSLLFPLEGSLAHL